VSFLRSFENVNVVAGSGVSSSLKYELRRGDVSVDVSLHRLIQYTPLTNNVCNTEENIPSETRVRHIQCLRDIYFVN
jgi:hypothetical protein